MNRNGHDSVKYFLGREVEHTPAYGKRTLFVVGCQDTTAIDDALRHPLCAGSIEHIFFGANDSYHPKTANDHQRWEDMIMTYLSKGYWCSLDIPMQSMEKFNDGGLCDHNQFIPIIKVPVPYIRLWNYNTCIKIDDCDFAATNPGVWMHRLHTLMDPDKFTDWSHYHNDKVL